MGYLNIHSVNDRGTGSKPPHKKHCSQNSHTEDSPNICNLSEEILNEIFKNLGFKDLSKVSQTNIILNRIAYDWRLWRHLGLQIGISELVLEKYKLRSGDSEKYNLTHRVKEELNLIKLQAEKASVEKPSLNTPDEVNQVKHKILKYNYRLSCPDLPESIQALLESPATRESVSELDEWIKARSIVIVIHKLKKKNKQLTHFDSNLLKSDKWNTIFDSYNTWCEENRIELEKIKKLRISIDRLYQLAPNIFAKLINLEELSLTETNLYALDIDALKGLSNLKELNLYENKLVILDPGTFDGLGKLKELWLTYNQIKWVHPDTFDGLKKLKELYLSVNDLRKLHPDTFDGLEKLEKLYLNKNKLNENDPALGKLPKNTQVVM